MLKLAKDHWTWFTSFVYIYVSVVGMVDAWKHFNAFGINVFEFAEINDFLLAAFREPQSFLVILLLIVLGLVYFVLLWFFSILNNFVLPRYFSKSWSWALNIKLTRIYTAIAILTSLFYLLAAPYYGPRIYNDN